MQRFALRYWALRQFFHCVGLLAGKGFTLRDLLDSFKQDILLTFVRGHLNEIPFIGMDDDYPELKLAKFLSVERLERIAHSALARLESMDTARSGMLRGYATAQKRHLEGCERCRRFACDTIIGNAIETAKIRDILKRADWP